MSDTSLNYIKKIFIPLQGMKGEPGGSGNRYPGGIGEQVSIVVGSENQYVYLWDRRTSKYPGGNVEPVGILVGSENQ